MPLNRPKAYNKKKKLNAGGQIGATAGSMAGQALIPIPGVGSAIGAFVGEGLGKGFEQFFASIFNGEKEFNLDKTQGANLGATYREGGALPIGQDAIEFKGPKHEQGGIPLPGMNVEVEGGETLDNVAGTPFVFSQELKVPGTNTSFAQFHKRLVANGADETAINKLASLQESSKRKTSTTDPRKMPHGGPIHDDPTMLDGILVEGENGLRKAPTMFGRTEAGPTTLRGTVDPGITLSDPGGSRAALAGAHLSRFGKGAHKALPFVGDAINIGRGLFGKTDVPEATKIDRSHIDALPTTVDTTAETNAANRAFRSIIADPSASVNEKLVAHGQQLDNLGRIQSGKRNAEADLAINRADAIGRANEFDAIGEDHRNRNIQDVQAAKSNLLSQGVAGLSRTAQALQRDKTMGENDMLSLSTMIAQLPDGKREAFITSILPSLSPAKRAILQGMLQK